MQKVSELIFETKFAAWVGNCMEKGSNNQTIYDIRTFHSLFLVSRMLCKVTICFLAFRWLMHYRHRQQYSIVNTGSIDYWCGIAIGKTKKYLMRRPKS